jgi:maltose alpha-D-glucosyltransferase / alpha-amylase
MALAIDTPLDDALDWYKDAVIYQLHVRAFADSNGDGSGDFRGLTGKLDYLQDLGVTAIWLLPFYPSPLRDDGYDIADYTGIHPQYGAMRDFRAFLRGAHRRGLRVITELVINHTSDQHPWFQRARHAPPGSRYRDFYVWSDTPDRYTDARIIFKDFEASNWEWDPVARQYYWHRFYAQQPDLNFDSPHVRRAVIRALDFWFEMGVDGLRLDAIPYLYEREGTTCENLPETHDYLRELRAHVDRKFSGRMLLAEANQWPEDAIAYFGEGDECHMAFHFPLMPRLFMAIRQEDRFPIIDILQQTPAIPESAQWAVFLRNHDELTLEMVTDEERDYMYRVYAHDRRARINLGIRRRLSPLLETDRRKIELMNGLLFSMPGTPIVYYGDEIGMGDNIYLGDRNGVRTPMQWSPDRNAGFSQANPQQLYLPVIIDPVHHYETVNVETQQRTPHSLLWWMKRLISLRKRHAVFGRGEVEFLYPENRKVFAYLRRDADTTVLVVANLSRYIQCVELDLAEFRGTVPRELFGHTRFPPIGDLPYFLTLGPYAFYWFELHPERMQASVTMPAPGEVPTLRLAGDLDSALEGSAKARLESILPADLKARRWFAGKARTIQSAQLDQAIPVPLPGQPADLRTFVTLLRVDYTDGEPETYVLPLAVASGERAERVMHDIPEAVLARLTLPNRGAGVVYDALWERGFCQTLLDALARRRRFTQNGHQLAAVPKPTLRRIWTGEPPLEPHILRAEQSNASVIYGDRFILKIYRRLEPGTNPDREIGRFLTERASFAHTPPLAGALEVRADGQEPLTLGILQKLVPNEGDAWQYTLDVLGRYFEAAVADRARTPIEAPAAHLLELVDSEPAPECDELVGGYLQAAELLGRRTAEMHLALASGRETDFAPEPFSAMYQRSLYQSMRTLTRRTFTQLRRGLGGLDADVRGQAQELLASEPEIIRRYRAIIDRKIDAARIRCHGDYHLGQALFTGRDFVIIDFEGEPLRPLGERRLKRTPMRDVAGMLRSFDYAAYSALFAQIERDSYPSAAEAMAALDPWARFWSAWVSAAFLRTYLETAQGAAFLPTDRASVRVLLDTSMLEKAVYEVAYELANRPGWLPVPMAGIRRLLESRA